MVLLAIIWLILSGYILLKWTCRMMKKTIVWWDALMAMQTPIIGMVVFPRYLHTSQDTQDILIYISIGLMGVSFLLFMIKADLLKIKR